MSESATITLAAEIDNAERPALSEAAAMLGKCLATAGGTPRPVSLQLLEPYGLSESASAIIVSLLPEVSRTHEPIGESERRWNERLAKRRGYGAPVFVMTIFRHVRERNREGGIAPILERIRRLNRMAADLSHDYGIGIIDIDQAFAHVGGRLLGTDYRLMGSSATKLAGHTIARGLLSFDLDQVLAPALQENASAMLGDLEKISLQIEREFLLRKRAAKQTVQSPAGA